MEGFSVMSPEFAYRKQFGNGLVCKTLNDRPAHVCKNANMTRAKRVTRRHDRKTYGDEAGAKPLHYLKEWREFRRLTQEALADAVETTKGTISLLEKGANPRSGGVRAQSLSDKWARRLAIPLKTTAGMLFDHDPNSLPTDILEIWTSIPDEVKPQAKIILETFRRKGT